MKDFFKHKKILVVVAHPDDELLGLGGTLHHLTKLMYSEVKVVILGEGITSRSNVRDAKKWKEELAIHSKNILIAKSVLGYQHLSTHNFADNRFDSHSLLDIVKVIESEKEKFKPDIVMTHHGGDLNIDHQYTYEAVLTAFRPMKGNICKCLITFETPSSTEWRPFVYDNFKPNLFFELLKEDVEAKIEAMQAYEFEKREFPHPRAPHSLENLAKRWGVVVGAEYAEAFCVERLIA